MLDISICEKCAFDESYSTGWVMRNTGQIFCPEHFLDTEEDTFGFRTLADSPPPRCPFAFQQAVLAGMKNA